MVRILLILFVFILTEKSIAQIEDFDDGYLIEKCIVPYALVSKEGQSGLWNYNTKEFTIPFDSSFCQFFPEAKCLLKVTNSDSIYSYLLSNNQVDFWLSSYKEMRIYRNNNSITYSEKGHAHTVQKRMKIDNDDPYFFGEFGLEIIDDIIIVIDYKRREEMSERPLTNENGDFLIQYNPESKVDEYIYPKSAPGYCRGGVRNRKTRNWIITPNANILIKNYSGYLIEWTEFNNDSSRYNDESFFSVYDENGRAIKENIERTEILKTPEYRNLLVPKYKSNLIYPVYRDSNWMNKWLNYSDFYFRTERKTGVFRSQTNKILQEPVDFVHIPKFLSCSAKTVFENKEFEFSLLSEKIKIEITKGLNVELFSIVGGKSMYSLRVRNLECDSVYSFFFKFSNQLDSVNVVPFIGSELQQAINRRANDYRLMLNQLGYYSFNFSDSNICIVRNTWSRTLEANEMDLNSGVFNLNGNVWIVPPKYHTILRTEKGYTAYLNDPAIFPDDFDLFPTK